MKTIQHLSALAIITIIMGIVYTSISHVTSQPAISPSVGRSVNEEIQVTESENTVFAGWILCVSVVLINWLVTFYNYEKKHAGHDTQ